jgi:hypothetical protein
MGARENSGIWTRIGEVTGAVCGKSCMPLYRTVPAC